MEKEIKIELIKNGEEDLKIREYDDSGGEYKDYTLERFETLSFECQNLTHSYVYDCENEKVKNHIETSEFTTNESKDFLEITKFTGKQFIIEGRNLKEEEENKKIHEIIHGDITLKSQKQDYSKLSFSPFTENHTIEEFKVVFKKRLKSKWDDELETHSSVQIEYNRKPWKGYHNLSINIFLSTDEFEKIHNLIKFSKSHILKGNIWGIYGIYYDEDSFGKDVLTYKFLERFKILEKLNTEKYLPPIFGPVGTLSYNLETF